MTDNCIAYDIGSEITVYWGYIVDGLFKDGLLDAVSH